MAKVGSTAFRERVSRGKLRGLELKRRRHVVAPADLRSLERGEAGARPALRPYLIDASAELHDIVTALGGPEELSPQRLALAQDFCRLGAMLRTITALFFRTSDPELVSRAATLVGHRRAALLALGLDRFARELDLHSYLSAKDDGARRAAGDGANGAGEGT